jgi:two-component system, chemotaxis family, chemotaxis protein CheY
VLALIVDDSRAMRTILTRMLSSLGFDAVEADNGRTGLDALRAMPAPPDVVLVDWNMPEVDGLEFVAAVRSQPAWRAVRIMMVTNESEQGRIGRALVAGAHDYLIKPFTPDTVHDRLHLLGLVAEATICPGPEGHRCPEAPSKLTKPAEQTATPAGGTADDARHGAEVNRSGSRICDCCAGPSTVMYYPLDELFERDDDGPLSGVDRIYVCDRCFQLVETGHWSNLRHWTSPAMGRRAIRHLWMGLRQHHVGSPVQALPHRS